MLRKLSKVFMVFLMFFGIGIGPFSTAYAETLPFEVHNLDLPEPLTDADVKRYVATLSAPDWLAVFL